MKHRKSMRRILIALVLSSFTVSLGLAQEEAPQKNEKATEATAIAVSDLQGNWTATFSGFTGCGVSTLLIHFNLGEIGTISGVERERLRQAILCVNSAVVVFEF